MISIIIPAYNCENTIKDCIMSVLNQSVRDIEVILIDDGSTDSTVHIANALHVNDDRLKIFSRENKGISYTRNEGLKKANGEYICFLDSDDKMEADMIEKLLTKSELSICGYYIDDVGSNGSINCTNQVMIREKINIGKAELYEILGLDTRILYPLWNKLFRADIINKNKITFPDISCWEDACFVCRYLSCVNSVKLVNEPLYHYCVDRSKESLSKSKYDPNRKEQYFTIFDEFRKAAEKLGATEAVTEQNKLRLLRNIIGDFTMNLPGHMCIEERRSYMNEVRQRAKSLNLISDNHFFGMLTDPTSKMGYVLLKYYNQTISPIGYSLLHSVYQLFNGLRRRI